MRSADICSLLRRGLNLGKLVPVKLWMYDTRWCILTILQMFGRTERGWTGLSPECKSPWEPETKRTRPPRCRRSFVLIPRNTPVVFSLFGDVLRTHHLRSSKKWWLKWFKQRRSFWGKLSWAPWFTEPVMGARRPPASLSCVTPARLDGTPPSHPFTVAEAPFPSLQEGRPSPCLQKIQFSQSVVSDSLLSHELQHTRPPSASPAPGVHPNPCPLCRWCHPAISSSVVPFASCPQSFPASGSFQMSLLFTSGGQNIGVSLMHE